MLPLVGQVGCFCQDNWSKSEKLYEAVYTLNVLDCELIIIIFYRELNIPILQWIKKSVQ